MSTPVVNPSEAYLPVVLTYSSMPDWLCNSKTVRIIRALGNTMFDRKADEDDLERRYYDIFFSIYETQDEGISKMQYKAQQYLSLIGDRRWSASPSMALYRAAVQSLAKGSGLPPSASSQSMSSSSSTGSRQSKGVDRADFCVFSASYNGRRITGIGEMKMLMRTSKVVGKSLWGTQILQFKQTMANWDKCRQGLAQAIWYLHAANDVDGAVLGIFIAGSVFRRIVVAPAEDGKKAFLVEINDSKNPTFSSASTSKSFSDFFNKSALPSHADILFNHQQFPNNILSTTETLAQSAAARMYGWYSATIEIANTIPVEVFRPQQEAPDAEIRDGMYVKVLATDNEVVEVALKTETGVRNIRSAKAAIAGAIAKPGGRKDKPDDDDEANESSNRDAAGKVQERQDAGTSRSRAKDTTRRSSSPAKRSGDNGKGRQRGLDSKDPASRTAATDSVLNWRETLPKPDEVVLEVAPDELEVLAEVEPGFGEDAQLEDDEGLASEKSDDTAEEEKLSVEAMVVVMNALGNRMRLVSSEEMDGLVALAAERGCSEGR